MDAEAAVRLGADYAGVIFAGGPRALDARRAREVLAPTEGSTIARVGVFGDQSPDEISTMAAALELGVVQLHGVRSPEAIAGIALETGREAWAVVRIAGGTVPEGLDALFACARGIVLDSGVPGTLGGTGTAFDWPAVRERIDRPRAGRRVILAGGLTPDNVQEGIRVLRPDVVDVSSGVEAAVGLKDHARMAAFVQAVRSVS